jgi:hypothetical protein
MKPVIIYLILLFILITFVFLESNEHFLNILQVNNINDLKQSTEMYKFYNQRGVDIDYLKAERIQQMQIYNFIQSNDTVIQINGKVSSIIMDRLLNKKKYIIIGQNSIILKTLNKNINLCNNIKKNIYNKFKHIFNVKFNTIISCYGNYLPEFVNLMGDDFNYVNKIIYEADRPNEVDYTKFNEMLLRSGFKLMDLNNYQVNRYVFIRQQNC